MLGQILLSRVSSDLATLQHMDVTAPSGPGFARLRESTGIPVGELPVELPQVGRRSGLSRDDQVGRAGSAVTVLVASPSASVAVSHDQSWPK